MTPADRHPHSPARLGIVAAIGATGLGLVYMAMAGAPGRMIAMNSAALLLGLAVCAGVARHRVGGLAGAVGGALLLATALFGTNVEGAARWLMVGGLAVQPSLLLVPAMLVGFARRQEPAAALGLVLAAAAVALQPDRAMAGVLVAGLLALALLRHGRLVVATLAAAGGALLVALLRPDGQGAMPFVDGILLSAFDAHPLAGAAVWVGCAVMLLPAIAARRAPAAAVFGACWLAAIVAAGLGNYPTPLVGYGGSAILGYLLAVGVLPRHARAVRAGKSAGEAAEADAPRDDRLRAAAA